MVNLYLVGGAVRDHFRGVKSKDWDFAVEAESFSDMREWIVANGFEIFIETPQYFTIRARSPKDSFKFGTFDLTGTTFDFTLCRKEGTYTDGRHPDTVEVGTIHDDLSRRDFTMNAIAIDKDGRTIDPFGGVQDIYGGLLRCVGNAKDRMTEDGLRMVRAIRFYAQTGFDMDQDLYEFLITWKSANLLDNISADRIRDELNKSLKADMRLTLEFITDDAARIIRKIMDKGIWLEATSKQK